LFEEGTAQLRVGVDFDVALEERGQFVYRVTWSAAGNETQQDDWDFSAASRYAYFDVEAPEYCATLSIRHLTDGEITELDAQCIPHGDLGPIGVQPLPGGSNSVRLAQCTVPPPNYHAEWCAMLDQVAECTAEDCVEAKAMCSTLSSDPNAESSPGAGPVTQGTSESGAGCAIHSRPSSSLAIWLVAVVGLVRRWSKAPGAAAS
jgi:hypothetical protein